MLALIRRLVQLANLLRTGSAFPRAREPRHCITEHVCECLCFHVNASTKFEYNNNNGRLQRLITSVAPGLMSLHWHPDATGLTQLRCPSQLLWTAISFRRSRRCFFKNGSHRVLAVLVGHDNSAPSPSCNRLLVVDRAECWCHS